MRLMRNFLLPVLLLSCTAASFATPITRAFELELAQFGDLEYDASGSIVYDSSAVPVCTTYPAGWDGRDVISHNCTVENFIESLTIVIDELVFEISNLESRLRYEANLYEGNEGDFHFGNLHINRSDTTEDYSSELLLTASGFEAEFWWHVEGYSSGASGNILGTGFTFLEGLGGVELIFESAVVDGRLVRRVPEPGALALFALGLILLGINRRRGIVAPKS